MIPGIQVSWADKVNMTTTNCRPLIGQGVIPGRVMSQVGSSWVVLALCDGQGPMIFSKLFVCTYELYKLYLVSVNHRATVSGIRFSHVHSACSGSHWWIQHCHVPSCVWGTDPVRSTPGLGFVSFCSVCAVGLISFHWITDTCTQSKAAGPG